MRQPMNELKFMNFTKMEKDRFFVLIKYYFSGKEFETAMEILME